MRDTLVGGRLRFPSLPTLAVTSLLAPLGVGRPTNRTDFEVLPQENLWVGPPHRLVQGE